MRLAVVVMLMMAPAAMAGDAGGPTTEAERAEQMVRGMDAKKARAAEAQAEADNKAVLAGTATPKQVARVRARMQQKEAEAAAAAKAQKEAADLAAAKQKEEDAEDARRVAAALQAHVAERAQEGGQAKAAWAQQIYNREMDDCQQLHSRHVSTLAGMHQPLSNDDASFNACVQQARANYQMNMQR